jgi:hypothetical protein
MVQSAIRLSRSPLLRGTIEEWMAPDLSTFLSPGLLFIPLLLLTCALGWRRLRVSDWLCVLTFGYLALSARRHIPLLTFVSTPLVATQLTSAFRWVEGRKCPGWMPPALATVTCLGVLVVARGPTLAGVGFGIDKSVYPVVAADFMESEAIEGNMFNNYVDGNYFIWRRYPHNLVFVDGRIETYREPVMRLYYEVLNAAELGQEIRRFGQPYTSEGWRSILKRFDIRLCVVRYRIGSAGGDPETAGSQRDSHPLVDALWNDPEWALIFWDDLVVLFLRREAVGGRYVYRTRPDKPVADSPALDGSWNDVVRDLSHRIELGPQFDCFAARILMADALQHRGMFKEALPHLRQAARMRPRDGASAYNLAACLLKLGEAQESVSWFHRALKLGLAEPGKAWNGLGNAFLALGEYARAVQSLENSLRANPRYVLAWLSLSVVHERLGDRSSALTTARKALEVSPDDERVRQRLEMLRTRAP